MNWLKKGPELKMPKLKKPSFGSSGSKRPEIKPPGFLADLYYDLRDRRLLPLIALVVVAIAAVPFLLGEDIEQPTLPAPGAAALEGPAEKTSKLTVVEATPGLRDYHKRLKGRTPTDPFEQQYDEPAGQSSSSSESATTSSSGETSGSVEITETTVTGGSNDGGSPPGGSGSGGGAPSGNSPQPGSLTFFAYAIDVRISQGAGKDGSGIEAQDPVVKHKVLPQSPLPGEKAPVVTYLGPSRKAAKKKQEKVLLLVSGDVKSIDGEGQCASPDNTGVCQMLEVQPGFPTTFVYGENEVPYTVKVLSIDLVVTGHG